VTVLIVTGTDTAVGKTVATAALASAARQAGLDVAVCKPVQTGTVAGDDDLAEVGRLTGVTEPGSLAGLARYPQPLAPLAAAEQAAMPLPSRADLLHFLAAMDSPARLTLVEGAGGLLVELTEGVTLRDLLVDLQAPVLVATRAELGTLNHTALTLEALATRQLRCEGLVIGSWPPHPDAVQLSNRDALQRLAPVRAALPAGAGALNAAEFAAMSAQAFDGDWVRSLVD
jgi:dethiobiotin synthetase